MKNEKLIDALKAFEIESLTSLVGGTIGTGGTGGAGPSGYVHWRITGGGTHASGATYNDWMSSDGTPACDVKDGTTPLG
jgi:hypothetical protein